MREAGSAPCYANEMQIATDLCCNCFDLVYPIGAEPKQVNYVRFGNKLPGNYSRLNGERETLYSQVQGGVLEKGMLPTSIRIWMTVKLRVVYYQE